MEIYYMDYHAEEVQPLKDDEPELEEEANPNRGAAPEDNLQDVGESEPGVEFSGEMDLPYAERSESEALGGEGFSVQSEEEVDLSTFLQQYGDEESEAVYEPDPLPAAEYVDPSNDEADQSAYTAEDNHPLIDEMVEWGTLPEDETAPKSDEEFDLNLVEAEPGDVSQGEPEVYRTSPGEYYSRQGEALDNAFQLPEESSPHTDAEIEINPAMPEEISPILPEPVISVSPMLENEAGNDGRRIALILSGGGARGAFQVGAEKYARDVKGYHWDIIAGVSVGALNGAMLAMHRFTRLMEVWDSISDAQVYTGGFNLVSLFKIMLGAKSFYGNAPLQKLMQHEFDAGRIIDDLHVGAVSLVSGEYVQFTKECLELSRAILASASIPVVWPPVDVAPDRTTMVDGGVRNISPVGDVLDLEPDEIVIINCTAEQPAVAPKAADNVLSIGMRALDIMQNEIFLNDMREFLRINALVQEAQQQGCLLHNPKTGKLLKYYPCQVIEPDGELGGTLDFSQTSIQAALKAGVRRAREVLGRP
jgi:NTE family protein